ncbi:MAG: hypothetical protein VKJ05_02625 [Synechococcaceae cyanobacterium]|nr:hypothetical protein [Synechococcaceae cyanobacterium]
MVIAVVASGSWFFYHKAYWDVQGRSSAWGVCLLVPGDKQSDVSVEATKQVDAGIKGLGATVLASQQDRLMRQVAQLAHAQKSACRIGVDYFSNLSAALAVCTLTGIVALSALAFTSKKGWEGTSNFVINLGVSSGIVLFVVYTFSQFYGDEANYERQRARFVLARNTLNLVENAVASKKISLLDIGAAPDGSPGAPSGGAALVGFNADRMAILLRFVDSRLEVVNDLEFRGDPSFVKASAKRIEQILNGADPLQPAKP